MSLNLADCIALSEERFPAKTALALDDIKLSYAELGAIVRRVADALLAAGLERGDRVALILPNVPQFAAIYHGALHAGGVVVPLNPTARARELEFYLSHCGARFLFVWKDCAGEACRALEAVAAPPELIVVEPGMSPETPAKGRSFVEAVAGARSKTDMAQTAPDDTAVILYTSAVDGIPRGAELSHFNLFYNALVCREFIFKYYPEDVSYAVLPLFHGFGQTTMMNAALQAGGTVQLAPKFDTGKVLETIARERVTLMGMVPTMFHLLLSYKPEETFDLSSLRAAITGGAAMPQALADAFSRRFGTPVLEGYGLTETSPVAAFNRDLETNRPGSVGTPIWGTRIRVMREEGGFAAPGETGEVVVRGPNLMKGYYNNPAATEEVMADGWLRTGDYGYLDADGYLFLTGLKKDMLIRAGMNVYPREIERVLEGHPDVREAAVVGIPDPVRGEEPKAFIVLKNCRTPTDKELAHYCREHLAAYKCPRQYEIVPDLPRDTTGRICKEKLRGALRTD